MSNPLPANRIIIGAYHALWDNLRLYLRLAWAPFVTCGLFALVAVQAESPDNRALLSLIFSVIFFVLLVPVITAWHRLLLIGPGNKDSRLTYSFGKEEWLYIKAIIVLYVAYFLIAFLIGFLFGPLGLVLANSLPSTLYDQFQVTPKKFATITVGLTVGFFAFLCLVRFLLVLPAAAIGKTMTVVNSGHVTQGNTWRLLYAYGVSWLPLLYIQYIHTGTPDDIVAGENTGLFQSDEIDVIVAIIPDFLFYTISVAVLSLSYKALLLNERSSS